MYPHPATSKTPGFLVYVWRYFTGDFLDGKQRTNATWTKPGTAPSHHLNWWASKPRIKRLIWRWAIVLFPTAWITCYAFAPSYGINLMVIITLACIPYVFHHGVTKALSLVPHRTVVFVHDNVREEDTDDELDDFTLPEQLEGVDNVQRMLDESMEKHVPPDTRKRRRT